jgi:hypothetical protein
MQVSNVLDWIKEKKNLDLNIHFSDSKSKNLLITALGHRGLMSKWIGTVFA